VAASSGQHIPQVCLSPASQALLVPMKAKAENHPGADRDPQARSWITGWLRERPGRHHLAIERMLILCSSECVTHRLKFYWLSASDS